MTARKPLRAITLHQPHASLIAAGQTHIVALTWMVTYRGWLAIHAANPTVFSGATPEQLTRVSETTARLAAYLPPLPLPTGAIVGVARLTDILLAGLVRPAMEGEVTTAAHVLNPAAYAWGHFETARYAWLLTDVRPLADPVSCEGWRALWKVPPAIRATVEAQVGRLVSR